MRFNKQTPVYAATVAVVLTLLTSTASWTQVLPVESPETMPDAVPATPMMPEQMQQHSQQMHEQMQQMQEQMQQMMENMEEMSPEQRKEQMQQLLEQMQHLQEMMNAHHDSMKPESGMMGKPHPAGHPMTPVR